MPCKLGDFAINLRCNFLRIGIHSLEVKIGGLEQHGVVLEDRVQDVGLTSSGLRERRLLTPKKLTKV